MAAPLEGVVPRPGKPAAGSVSLARRETAPEWLDRLESSDPLAIASRADLRRLNWFMGHAGAFRKILQQLWISRGPLAITELGCGDGWLIERVLLRMPVPAPGSRLYLVDLRPSIPTSRLQALTQHGWEPQVCARDVFDHLKRAAKPSDILLANLFLHHFTDDELCILFTLISQKVRSVVAMEPRRSVLALMASRCLHVIGCNAVTRNDAPISVRAGFQAAEIAALWPDHRRWQLEEAERGLFSHAFTAWRLNA